MAKTLTKRHFTKKDNNLKEGKLLRMDNVVAARRKTAIHVTDKRKNKVKSPQKRNRRLEFVIVTFRSIGIN